MRNREVEQVVRRVRSVLREAGVYKPERVYLLELLAGDLLVYRKLLDYSLGAAPVVYETKSNGSEVERPNPIFAQLQAQAKQVREDLARLVSAPVKAEAEAADAGKADGLLGAVMGAV